MVLPITNSGLSGIACCMVAIALGSRKSSASRNISHSDTDAMIPRFRAAPAPLFSLLLMQRSHGRESAAASTTASSFSSAPSITTVALKSLHSCRSRLLMASPMVSAQLCAGIMMSMVSVFIFRLLCGLCLKLTMSCVIGINQINKSLCRERKKIAGRCIREV